MGSDEDCYINGFSRCLNGGICPTTMTLVNGTCGNYDLLRMNVKAPGISRMVKDLGIPLKELLSKSSTSLGARDVLREHIFDKLDEDNNKFIEKYSSLMLKQDDNKNNNS